MLTHAGEVPREVLERLSANYPWLRLHDMPGAEYADMKAEAQEVTTGEIVVWADSDCRYNPDWLRSLITPFAERPDIGIVRGETTVEIVGPYSLANALSFNFPRFSGEAELTGSPHYHANNVAFRREVLEQVPLPRTGSLARAHFYVHSRRLARAGHTIWRQPNARALHAPTDPRYLLRRFAVLGRDGVRAGPLAAAAAAGVEGEQAAAYGLPPRRVDRLRHIRAGWTRKTRARARRVANREPGALVHLPLALPVVALSGACYYAGRLAALFEQPRSPAQ